MESLVKRRFPVCLLAALAIELRIPIMYSSKKDCPIMRVITDGVLSQTGKDIEDTIEEVEWLMARAGEIARQTGKDIKEVIRELGRQDVEALIGEIEKNEVQASEVIKKKIKGMGRFDTKTMVEVEFTEKQAEIVDTIFALMDESLKSLCNNQRHSI